MYKYIPSAFIGELFTFRVSLGDLLELISFEESLLSTLDILNVPGLSPPVIDISERFRLPNTDPGYCIWALLIEAFSCATMISLIINARVVSQIRLKGQMLH